VNVWKEITICTRSAGTVRKREVLSSFPPLKSLSGVETRGPMTEGNGSIDAPLLLRKQMG
jgi:hypothetical protein